MWDKFLIPTLNLVGGVALLINLIQAPALILYIKSYETPFDISQVIYMGLTRTSYKYDVEELTPEHKLPSYMVSTITMANGFTLIYTAIFLIIFIVGTAWPFFSNKAWNFILMITQLASTIAAFGALCTHVVIYLHETSDLKDKPYITTKVGYGLFIEAGIVAIYFAAFTATSISFYFTKLVENEPSHVGDDSSEVREKDP